MGGPARAISEAIRLALEQVWPGERGLSCQSVGQGDGAGSREEARCSECEETELGHSCLHLRGLPVSTSLHPAACPEGGVCLSRVSLCEACPVPLGEA